MVRGDMVSVCVFGFRTGVQRWPENINEFHGRHYRLTPTGVASPVCGIGGKFLVFMVFAESAGIGGFPRYSGVFGGLSPPRPGRGADNFHRLRGAECQPPSVAPNLAMSVQSFVAHPEVAS